jgi:hypothetical protein
MKKTILAILTGAALAVGSANAAVVFGNLGANGNGAIAGSSGPFVTQTAWYSLGFTANGSDLVLDTATIGYRWGGTSNTIAKLDLFTSVPRLGGGTQPGSLLYSSQVSVVPANNGTLNFTYNQTLTAGTSYWFVYRPGQIETNNLTWRPASPASAPTALNGSTWASIGTRASGNSGSTWSGSLGTGNDISISVGASPIPEPGTWAAMAIFASGAAYAGWRRRRQQLA